MTDSEVMQEMVALFKEAAEAKCLRKLNRAYSAHSDRIDAMKAENSSFYHYLRASYAYHKKLITGKCWAACDSFGHVRAECSRECVRKK